MRVRLRVSVRGRGGTPHTVNLTKREVRHDVPQLPIEPQGKGFSALPAKTYATVGTEPETEPETDAEPVTEA